MIEITKPIIKRFLSKLPAQPYGRCWEWGSYKDTCGYGKFKIGPINYMAHRIAYQIYVGPIPDWATVLRHSCDNPGCVNPAHLQPGTQIDNAYDRKSRGREGKHHGELNGRQIVPECDIAIVRQRVSGGERQSDIAKEYGVTRQAIYRIVHSLTWKHI